MINSFLSRRWFFLRTETDRILALSILFSVMLVLAGMIYTSYFVFLFLVWNLFLGYIPYAISSWLQQAVKWQENRKLFSIAFLAWLLFIPNSFYIVTDIFHLRETYWVPLWFDLIVLVSFAFNGALLGYVSIRQMERMMELRLGGRTALYFTWPVFFLNGLGVYIGRYLRYNSWDFVTNPLQLFADIINLLIHPLDNRYAWGMIFCFSFLLALVYLVIKRMARMIV